MVAVALRKDFDARELLAAGILVDELDSL